MERKFFEIALVIPSNLRFFPLIQEFLRSTRSHFSALELPEIQLYVSVVGNSLTVVLRFDRALYQTSSLNWFRSWIQKLMMEVVELDILPPSEREVTMGKYDLLSEQKFRGEYDLEQTLSLIEDGYYRRSGIRKESRISTTARVRIKKGGTTTSGFAENISRNGMFIRGGIDLPLYSQVEMAVELSRVGEVKMIGKIVHIVSEAKISLMGGRGSPGFGVQILGILGDGEDRLRDYLEKYDKFK